MAPRSCAECKRRRIACVGLTAEGCQTCLRRKLQCGGPPKKEEYQKHTRVAKGAKMAEVREAFGTNETTLDVATVNSPASRLLTFELAAALHYHLVQAARLVGRNTTPGTRLDPLAYQLAPTNFRRHKIQMVLNTLPPSEQGSVAATSVDSLGSRAIQRRAPIFSEHADTTELVHACFSAFGARWSSHSAIVGPSSPSTSSQLGAQREGPCHALIDRAIAIAEGSGLLSMRAPTIKQARAAAYLLQTAHVVAPNHHAVPSLIRTVHELRLAAYSNQENLTREAHWNWENPIPDTALLDAQHALRSHSACTLSDEDISRSYAWSPSIALKSAKHLESLIPREWDNVEMEPESIYFHLCAVNLYRLRSLALLRQQGYQQPPIFIYTSFAHLADLSDTTATLFDVKREQIASSATLLEHGWLDMLNGQARDSLSFASYVCASIQAVASLNEGWAQSDLRAEMSDRFAKILIRTLKRLIESPTLQELDDVTRLMDVAPLFADMDTDFEWLQLVVSAADPSSPFSDLGLTMDHVARLQDALERIGKLYGAVSQQSQMLSEGLLSPAGLPGGSVLQGFVEEMEDDHKDTLAESMVDVVLSGLAN